MEDAVTAALGVLTPDGMPMVTRIGFGLAAGMPITLVSDLSLHTSALGADPRASILVGEIGARGDPLTHPRLTLQTRATFVARTDRDHDVLSGAWLAKHPKAKLYIGFTDFRFVRFQVTSAFLNGGFGKAFRLTPEDLR
jgi:putative heme iron utilization protein